MTEQELYAYIASIRPADEAAMAAARRRQAELAKPPGSLGRLEEMAVRMAGVTGQVCPAIGKCRVAVFAADNGVVTEGVSCAPQSVTLRQAEADGISALGIGEMGIGNTTTSAAVLSVLLDTEVEAVTGRGGGLTDEGFDRKKQVLRRALALHRPDKNDVLDVLHKVGGLDIAAMTGAFLGCAHEGIAAAVDGYISVAAALCAVRLCPAAGDYLFLSHQSYELGYAKAAQALGLTPCLALDMRLGEGSGCPLLFRVLEGACGVMANMATFAEAAIQDDYLEPIRSGDSFTVETI